ncbi:ABC transporter permease [bacterium]|nr:ABC transporter permease [bacterium]
MPAPLVRKNLFEKIVYLVISAGQTFLSFTEYLGGVTKLSAKTIYNILQLKIDGREFINQFLNIGNRSFAIVMLIAVFTGMVMALQLAIGLKRFGLGLYIGQVVGLSIVRELGPVLTSVMIAARCGSGMAAEIGSMVVTEQVLAIEAMGANPVRKLVVPRVLATVIAAPLLTVMANIVGLIGAMFVAVMETGVTASFFFAQVSKIVRIDDFASGVLKTFFFGFFIAVIACYQGLRTSGGTAGVGYSTTRAVVYSSIVIFISDFFLTKLILLF